MLSCYALRKVAIGTRCASGERLEGSQFLSQLGYQFLEGEITWIIHDGYDTQCRLCCCFSHSFLHLLFILHGFINIHAPRYTIFLHVYTIYAFVSTQSCP
jgi:hypothetical protein